MQPVFCGAQFSIIPKIEGVIPLFPMQCKDVCFQNPVSGRQRLHRVKWNPGSQKYHDYGGVCTSCDVWANCLEFQRSRVVISPEGLEFNRKQCFCMVTLSAPCRLKPDTAIKDYNDFLINTHWVLVLPEVLFEHSPWQIRQREKKSPSKLGKLQS